MEHSDVEDTWESGAIEPILVLYLTLVAIGVDWVGSWEILRMMSVLVVVGGVVVTVDPGGEWPRLLGAACV